MSDAVQRLSGAKRQESLQWRMFYISMGLGLVTGLLAALVAHLVATHAGRTLVAASLPEDDPLNSVLHGCGVPAPLAETEMVLDLRARNR